MVARVHPELQDEVLARLLANAQREPATATALREFCEQFFERRMEEDSYVSSELRLALTEQAMLCGRLDDATRYLQLAEGPLKQFYEAAIAALRGEQAGAIVAFEAALKALRRESGKRKQLFEGMGGHLYILALLRSGDAKHLKSAETYLDSALRAPHNHDTAVYQQLNLLRQIRAGTLQADVVHGRAWEAPLQAQMFQSLLYYWLSLPELNARGAELQELAQHAEQARRAAALRARLGFADMTLWFERQEAWQRQLTALINLQQPAAADSTGAMRLAWMLDYDARHGLTSVEPREQKRDARGAWSKGRAIGLKRLRFESEQIDYLTPQDLRAAEAISVAHRNYHSSGLAYEW